MENIHLAWAAGFWEGEGSCRGRAKITVEASATQTRREPLERLEELFGGTVYENKSARKHNPRAKQSWAWCVNGLKAREFLQSIRPHIISPYRIEQIDKALACPMGNRSWWPDLPDKLQAIEKAIGLLMTKKRNGQIVRRIAKQFGVSPKTVYNIREKYLGRKSMLLLRGG